MGLPLRISLRQDVFLSSWFNADQITSLEFREDGCLVVVTELGAPIECRVRSDTVVYESLIVLRFDSGMKTSSLVLHSAMTGREQHRRLRVWLNARVLGSN